MAMSKTILVYSPKYNTDLSIFGVSKPFALDRGQMVLDQLEKDRDKPVARVEPDLISVEDLELVHTKRYLETLKDSEVWKQIFELRHKEFFASPKNLPLSDLFDDIRLKCGGTLLAAELALQHKLAANLGGGYHHAFPDRGRGFCVLNDIAVSIRSLQKRGLVKNVLIVDLDFHQGDGTALIFKNDPTVFTLSVHSEEGWPEEKQQSTLDVGLYENQMKDYQQHVEKAVDKALQTFTPDLVIYIGGSDPYEKDVLAGTKFMQLTLDEMNKRDKFVIDKFADKQIPLAMVFAGGYGPHVWEVHYFAVKHLLNRAGC